MRSHKTPIFLILALSLVFTLPAWAQDSSQSPDQSQGQDQSKPFTEQQVLDMVKAGLGADAGAKLIASRGLAFIPSKAFLLRLKASGAKGPFLKALSANKPLSEKQVNDMVQAGLGDDSGAQIVTKRGLDFAPTEEYVGTLKTAGAKDPFLKAVRDKMPINQVQIVAELAAESPTQRITTLVKARGVDFNVKDDYLQQVRAAGGDDALVAAVKGASVLLPDSPNAAAQAKQVEVRQHVAHGAELKLKGQYPDAEKDFRAAIALGPPNADVYLALAMVLGRQKKWDDDVTAARQALKLDPNNAMSHIVLGLALAGKSDWDGAIAEDREALRLNSEG